MTPTPGKNLPRIGLPGEPWSREASLHMSKNILLLRWKNGKGARRGWRTRLTQHSYTLAHTATGAFGLQLLLSATCVHIHLPNHVKIKENKLCPSSIPKGKYYYYYCFHFDTEYVYNYTHLYEQYFRVSYPLSTDPFSLLGWRKLPGGVCNYRTW